MRINKKDGSYLLEPLFEEIYDINNEVKLNKNKFFEDGFEKVKLKNKRGFVEIHNNWYDLKPTLNTE